MIAAANAKARSCNHGETGLSDGKVRLLLCRARLL